MKLNKFISLITACAVMTAAQPMVSSAETDWRELYREKLTEMRQLPEYNENWRFDLCDLDRDGCPELIITFGYAWDDYSGMQIYTVSDGRIMDLGGIGENEGLYSLYFSFSEGKLMASTSEKNVYCIKMENQKLVTDYTLERIWLEDEQEFYYTLNGWEITYDTFCKMAYFDDEINLGSRYRFGSDIIDYALRDKEEMSCIQRSMFIAELMKLTRKSGEPPIDRSQFELADYDRDGCAELGVSYSTSYAGGACRIFTFSENCLNNTGYVGYYGNYAYNAERKLVYSSIERQGMTYGDFYRFNSGERKPVISYRKNDEDMVDYMLEQGYEAEYSYVINGEQVSRDVWYSSVQEYEDCTKDENNMVCGRMYNIDYASIVNVFYGADTFENRLCAAGDCMMGIGYELLQKLG